MTHETRIRGRGAYRALHWLWTKFPCCGQRAKFFYVPEVPREQYDRKCAHCGQKWEVERRTARVHDDRRVDILDWTKGA